MRASPSGAGRRSIRDLESVKARAKQAIDWEIAQGAGFIRTHADTSDEGQLSMRALLEVKDEVSNRVDLQIVAFPQDGIHSHPGGPELFIRALDMGPDVIGGIPHNEGDAGGGRRQPQVDLRRGGGSAAC